MKPFLAFDVDGTLFKSSLLEKIVLECIRTGIFSSEKFSNVFKFRTRWQAHNNEKIYHEYIDCLVNTFVKEIKGVDTSIFRQAVENMISEHRVRRFAFPMSLIEKARKTHRLVAISGSPEFLVSPFIRDLKVDKFYGSTFEHNNRKFTGKFKPVEDKGKLIKQLIKDGQVCKEGSIAVGDTIGDLSMLKLADHPIAFNASATLTQQAKKLSWLRVHETKDNIIGLSFDETAEAYKEISIQKLYKQILERI